MKREGETQEHGGIGEYAMGYKSTTDPDPKNNLDSVPYQL